MKIAAFTMVYNEPIFLPLWARHYGRAFGAENLFCLDHGSDDGSAVGAVANTIRLPRGAFDEARRAAAISAFQATLLGYYDAVIFSDTDEFLVADPAAYPGLRPFIEQRCARAVTALGFNVLQVAGKDAPMDWSRPILGQRRLAQFEIPYSKTLISRIPIKWKPGFHNASVAPDHARELYLFHLKFADYDTFHQAQDKRQSVQWSAESIDAKHGPHWRRGAETFRGRLLLREDPPDTPSLDDPRLAERELQRAPEKAPGPGGIYTIPERFRDAIPGIASD